MQIVIDIDDEDYNQILNDREDAVVAHDACRRIAKGIVLSKGHGRLIDVSDLTPDSDYEDGIFYAVSIGQINGAPTIVEADRSDI